MPDTMMTPASAPVLLPSTFSAAVIAAALPHIDKDRGITSRAALARALYPLMGTFTVIDAIACMALLKVAFNTLPEARKDGDINDRKGDAVHQVIQLLEDFASHANASSGDDVSARIFLFQKGEEDDCWEISSDNKLAMSKQMLSDSSALRGRGFKPETFDSIVWLYRVVEENDGADAASELADEVRETGGLMKPTSSRPEHAHA